MTAVAAVRPPSPPSPRQSRPQHGPWTAAAGSSTSARHVGRVAVQDGAELTPTFDWASERTLFLMAGGQEAFIASIEGAEDDAARAVRQLEALSPTPADVVIGVAASGRRPTPSRP